MNQTPSPTGPELTPPGAPPPDAAGRSAGPWIGIALVLLLALGLAVVWLLPQWLEPASAPQTSAQPGPEQPGSNPPEPAHPSETPAPSARPDAEAALQAWLQTAARLENARAPAWAPAEWSATQKAAEEGDRLFTQRRFAEAAASYAAGQAGLEALEASRTERLAEALAAGRAALAADDGDAAAAGFELALIIEPGHPEADNGVKRARVRNELLDLMRQAQAAEAGDDLPGALEAYREAAALDPEYGPAGEGLDRVVASMRAAVFQAAMGRALAALDAGDLTDAATLLDKAAQVNPDDPALSDARSRLDRKQRQARIRELERRAGQRAAAERWDAAAGLYRQVQGLAPEAAAARRGLQRAEARIDLHRRLDAFLGQPERLAAEGPRQHARALLAANRPAPPGEPELARKLAALEQALEGAAMPLAVRLQSDGLTQVSIHRVGPLGRFLEHRLELNPGRYTAVGTRDGYRDVRREFEIQRGKTPAPIRIQCEEAI